MAASYKSERGTPTQDVWGCQRADETSPTSASKSMPVGWVVVETELSSEKPCLGHKPIFERKQDLLLKESFRFVRFPIFPHFKKYPKSSSTVRVDFCPTRKLANSIAMIVP